MPPKYQALENASEKLARLLTATGTRVVFTPKVPGPMADLDKNLVLLPPLPEKLTPDEFEKLQGAIDHEVAHLLFTKDAAGKIVRKPDGFEGLVMNGLEDGRINRKMGNRYIGSQDNIRKLVEMAEVTTREMIAEKKLDPNSDEFKAISALIKAATLYIWKRPDVAKIMGTDGDEVLSTLPDALRRELEAIETTEDVLRATPKVAAWLKSNRTPPPPQPQPQDGQSEDEQESDGEQEQQPSGKGEGKGQGKQGKAGKDKKPGKGSQQAKQEKQEAEEDDDGQVSGNSMDGFDDDEKDDESAEGEGEGESEDEGESKDGESEDGEGQGEDKGDAGEGDEAEAEESEEGDAEGEGSGDGEESESDEDGEADGEGEESGEGEPGEEEADGDSEETMTHESESLPQFTKEQDEKYERDIAEMMKEMEDAARLKLPSSIMDGVTSDPRTYSADTTGDIEQTIHELYDEVRRTGHDETFLKTWATETFKDYKSHVGTLRARLVMDLQAKGKAWVRDLRRGRGIDTSQLVRPSVADPRVFRHKIRKDKVDTVVTLLIDCSGSMSGKKIQTAMQLAALFSDALEMARVPCEVLGFTTHDSRPSPKFGVRSDGVRNIILKGFHETLAVTRDKWVAAFPVRNSNNDGESIMWAAKRIARRKEERKILLVLSDGYPAIGVRSEGFDDGRPAYDIVYAYTAYAVKLAEQAGIEVLGIGIMSDAVGRFYPKWIQYKGLQDLMSGFYRTVSELLRTGKLQVYAK